MSSKQQIEWVNIAKGLTMMAVVVGHIEYVMPHYRLLPVMALLTGWHVPVFFLISGFFIKEERLRQPETFIRGKTKTLYLKLMYFYIPAVLLHNAFIDIGFYDTVTSYGGKIMSYYDGITLLKKVAETICFAGREPIMGATWFVYVLFLALCGFSISSWALSKWIKDERNYEATRLVLFFTLCIISCTLTQMFDFTIRRASNTLTALWLIYCGYMLRNHLKVKFNNGVAAVVSGLCVYHCATIVGGGVSLNGNSFSDSILLTVVSISALYMTCFISQKLEGKTLGHWIARCGKESFYLMALQFVGFKVGTLLLSLFGVEKSLSALIAPAQGSLLLFFYYLLMGVCFPLVFMWVFRLMKEKILVLINNKKE